MSFTDAVTASWMAGYENIRKNTCNGNCNKKGCDKGCTYGVFCGDCLKKKFFEKREEYRLRPYDCVPMTFFYTMYFGKKYAAEIACAMKKCFENGYFQNCETFNIASIGCGPSTELYGLIDFLSDGKSKKTLNYKGFDTNGIWGEVHKKLMECIDKYSTLNACNENKLNILANWHYCELTKNNDFLKSCNLLILNYVVSDIYKKGESDALNDFLNNTLKAIIDELPAGAVIIINDGNSNALGRDEVNAWCNTLQSAKKVCAKGYYFKHQKEFRIPDYTELDCPPCTSAFAIMQKK